jgi:uncharacterized protein YbjT (DUF2867 family)
MSVVLVTGATGTLGKPTTVRLAAAGHDVRALSRRGASGLTTGDLLTGAGIPEAMDGVDAVVHLATGKRDVDQAKTAIDAARDSGVGHFVLISIVGIDDIPLGYYQGKVEIEQYLKRSGVPYTIQRATQFHQFVEGIFLSQKLLPVILAPQISFQPISTEDVASRLTTLVGAFPAGRVDGIGGPEKLSALELARAWKAARGSRKAVWNPRLPGKTVAGFAAGHNLVAGDAYGVTTFTQYLAEKYGTMRVATPQ